MITILNPIETVENPTCLVRTSEIGESWKGESRVIKGRFARVFITTGRDWKLIKMMQHGQDYFAPCNGNGLMVKAELLRKP